MKSTTNKKTKQKSIRCIVFVLVFCAGVFLSFLLCRKSTYAYTREEIEAAKAWLSGHGYSPDAGGAAQAYNDYLNGKFGEVPGAPPVEQQPETMEQLPEAVVQPSAVDKGSGKKTTSTDDAQNQPVQQQITASDEGKTDEAANKTDTIAAENKSKDSKNSDEEPDAFLMDKLDGNAADFFAEISEMNSDEQGERKIDESLKVTVERTDKAAGEATEDAPEADNENTKKDAINETVVFLFIIVGIFAFVLILRTIAVRRRNHQ